MSFIRKFLNPLSEDNSSKKNIPETVIPEATIMPILIPEENLQETHETETVISEDILPSFFTFVKEIQEEPESASVASEDFIPVVIDTEEVQQEPEAVSVTAADFIPEPIDTEEDVQEESEAPSVVQEETVSDTALPHSLPLFGRLSPLKADEEISVPVVEDSDDSEKTSDEVEDITACDNSDDSFSDILPIEDEEDDKKEPLSIASYFAEKGIDICFSDVKNYIAPIESLAFKIALNYTSAEPFIHALRNWTTNKCFTFTYSLTKFTPAEKNAIKAVAKDLDEYGIITIQHHTLHSDIITGEISSAPKCITFLNGDFMELYAKCVTAGTLKRVAKKYDSDYELLTNVHIVKDGKRHELDMVFRLGNKVFWGEVKSSNFHPDTYRKLGIFLEMIPDRLIILAAKKSNEAAAGIGYLNDCYCANINTFKNSLNEMIDKAFTEVM